MATSLINGERPSKKERKLMQALSEIEVLVNRANYRNEFLEVEIQQKLEQIFDDPYSFPSSDYNHLKKVLFMITGIEKSSNFGYYFYNTLQENPFPFCGEVLKSAVYNERYYNLNDKALKAYVRVYMIESGFDSHTVLHFDDIIPEGHGYHYFDTFSKMENLELTGIFPLKPCFFDLLYAVINRDTFPMTQKKAATIIGLLRLDALMDTIAGKSHQLLYMENPSSDHILVLVHLIKLVSMLRKEPLPKTLQERIQEIISCRCNGQLPGKFETMKSHFTEYVGMLWETIEAA